MCFLVQALLLIPLSNADIERTFSQLRLIKNERRNSLSNETTEALLISKIGFDFIDLKNKKVILDLSKRLGNYQKKKNGNKKKIEKRKADSITISQNKNELLEKSVSVDHEVQKFKRLRKVAISAEEANNENYNKEDLKFEKADRDFSSNLIFIGNLNNLNLNASNI